MALVDIYTLLPQVTPYVRNCTDAVQRQQLRWAARDFVRETEIWRETLDAVDTVVDQQEYTLDQPAGYDTLFKRLLQLKIDDVELALDNVTLDPEGLLDIGYKPSVADQEIVATVAFLPLEVCYEYPDWFVDRWQSALVNGTLMRLAAMDSMPWASRSVKEFERLYREDVSEANSERYTGRINKPLRVKMRTWF